MLNNHVIVFTSHTEWSHCVFRATYWMWWRVERHLRRIYGLVWIKFVFSTLYCIHAHFMDLELKEWVA